MTDSTGTVTTEALPAGLQYIDAPVLVFDEQAFVTAYNEAVSELLPAAVDLSDEDLLRYESTDRETVRRVGEGNERDDPVRVTLPTADGRQRYDLRLSALPDEEVGAVVGVGQRVPDDQQEILGKRERSLRRAYNIIADTDRSLDTKIHEMLGVVRETLGTEFATLSRTDGEEYIFEAIDAPSGQQFVGADGTRIEEGDTVPLSVTNCQRVVETGERLVAEDVAADYPELADRPGNADLGISCYLGTPVIVEGDTYGTFCFYGLEERSSAFSEWEMTFVELLGNWVSYELERERLMEQIRAEERKRYETLVEQSSDGVVIVQDGEYVFTNDRFLELSGRDRDAVIGTPFQDIFTPEYQELVTERYQKRIDGKAPPNQYDVEIETAAGQIRTLELAVSAIEHDGEPATMATFRDVTERNRREQSVQTLQQAVGEMQAAETREEIADIAVGAARDALGLSLSICWFYDEETERLEPVVAGDGIHELGYVEALSPDQYEYEMFQNRTVTEYNPSETGYDQIETGILLPLGEHGLLAAGSGRPTEHDDVVLDIARTLAEHTRTALDRVEQRRDLERAEARFRALTENTTHGVVTIDPDSTVQFASEGVEDVFGYEPAEMVGESLTQIMPERFHEPHQNAVARYLQEGTKELDWSWIELPGRHKDGHEVPLGITFGETTVDGEKRFSAVIRDITEQKERQQELREERAFTESVFETLPDVFYAFDEHGKFIRWNDRLEEVTGYSGDEIETMHPTDFVAPEDQARVVEAIGKVVNDDTTVTVEASFVTKDGEEIPYEFTGAKMVDDSGDTLGLVGIGRDISDRKERQRRFEAVFNNTYQFTGLMEPDGTLIEANETALEFGDIDREDVVGKKVWDAVWFAHSEELREQLQAATAAASSGEFVRKEMAVRGAEGEVIIDFSLRPVTDEDGNVTLLIPEGREITELKERERELRRERDHARRTEEMANVGGWELRLDDETLHWTQGTHRLHDVEESFEPTLSEAMRFVHEDDEEKLADAVQNCRETGDSFDIEVRIVTASGRTKWIRIEGDRVVENGTAMLRGVMGDITERKEREQRLMVLNRVLRHNLRNKLSAVSGYTEALETTLEEYTEHGELQVDTASSYTSSIKESIRELVDLGDKAREFEQAIGGNTVTQTAEMETVLTEVADGCRDTHPDAEISVTAGDQSFQGNVEFLRLAVEELIDNAVNHNDHDTPRVSIEVTAAPNDRLEITVADNGPGIPKMERSTLTEGEESSLLHGSGVGLWTVNWLVTRIGGQVSIADNDARGTAVTLLIPESAGVN